MALTSGAAIRTPAVESVRWRRCGRRSRAPNAGSRESAGPIRRAGRPRPNSVGTSGSGSGSSTRSRTGTTSESGTTSRTTTCRTTHFTTRAIRRSGAFPAPRGLPRARAPAPAAGLGPIGRSADLMASGQGAASASTNLTLALSARQASDFELLANGGFAPLEGFLGSEDWTSVCDRMRLASGDIWSIPITLATDLEASVGDVVELSAPNGKALGRLTVEEVFERDVDKEAELVYLTTDDEHPGVAAIRREGSRCLAGPIEADALPDHDDAFMRRYLTPEQSKQAFADRGWKRIVAFPTRNPIHRAHEYL